MRTLPDSRPSAADFEKRCNLLGENPIASHARVPLRIIQPLTAAQMSDAPEYLFFSIGEMLFEPSLEERCDRPRQTHYSVAGKLRARFRAGRQNRRHFVVR